MSAHVCEVSEDDDGWLTAACACGWSFGPVPDWETAADCVGDHREAVGRGAVLAVVRAQFMDYLASTSCMDMADPDDHETAASICDGFLNGITEAMT